MLSRSRSGWAFRVLRIRGRSTAAARGCFARQHLPYGPIATGDGGSVVLGLHNEREWKQFCESVLLQPQLTMDPRFDSAGKRNATRDALEALIVSPSQV